jgi:DNA-binding transcriptional LysR family regulator
MIRGIECLLSLEETHHFGAAARRLGISQSALSQAIANLERELDARLVLRARTFEGFTPAGEAVLAQGRTVLRTIRDLRAMVERCRDDAGRRFVVGIIPVTTFVAPVLSALLLESHPATSLSVEVGDVHFVARGIRERRLDAGIVYLVPELLRDMVQYPLYEERYCLVSPAGAGESNRRPITWRDAAQVPMAMLTPSMLNRRLIDEVFAAQGLTPTLRLESDSILSLLTHVERGVCSAILPRSVVPMLGAGSPLGIRPLVAPVMRHTVGLVMLREQLASPWGRDLDALFRGEAFGRTFAAFADDPPDPRAAGPSTSG